MEFAIELIVTGITLLAVGLLLIIIAKPHFPELTCLTKKMNKRAIILWLLIILSTVPLSRGIANLFIRVIKLLFFE